MNLKSEKSNAIFLDRDGVINKDIKYLYKSEDFVFLPEIFELCNFFIARNYKIFVITNQSGIARGFFSEQDFKELNTWMLKKFMENGVTISKVYFDPTHLDGVKKEYTRASFDRKPNPGMILNAEKEFNLDLKNSILIGDKDSDILCGINAKVGKNYKLFSKEYPEDDNIYKKEYSSSKLIQVKNLKDIIKLEKLN